MSISVVDLSFRTQYKELKSFVSQLGKACEEVGFVAVKNEAIPDNLITDIYHAAQHFFIFLSTKN